MLTDQAILRHIERQPHHSAGYKQLVREMNLRGEDRRQLASRLLALVKSGRVLETGRGRYTLAEKAATSQNLIAGRLTMHRDGYGFVIPNSGQRGGAKNDIFIPPTAIGSAMHGDQVLVELGRGRDDGRSEGRIMRVLTRGNATVVGTFRRSPRQNYVVPIDEKVTQQIIIPRGMEWPHGDEREIAEKPVPRSVIPNERSQSWDQRVSSSSAEHLSRDRVLGNEAQRKEWDDLDGVVVEVEITSWPSPTESPRGRVIEILGYEDDFGVDVEIIIRKHHLPHQFPVEVLQEAQQYDPVIPSTEMRHRRDYRDEPIVTIDGETARDFDDAVTVTRLPSGHFELQVHIADVAHYVREGSPIDLEARLRGTSVYFPDRAVPMLPIELSTDLCSLRPQVERMVLSCVMEIDPQGEIVGYTLNEGVIRSAERMTYTNVNLILEGDADLRERYQNLVDVFELMRELAMILNRKRVRRGSIDFDLPEPIIEFDQFGLMQSIGRSERNIANRIIEEFMLSANECVAGYLEGRNVPSLYRIHEKPDPKRVMDFETIAAKFGYSLGVGPLPVKRVQFKAERRERAGTGRAAKTLELPEDVHITPRMYQKLTQKIAGKPEERILSYLMLRSLRQARYLEKNEGHFALAAPTYTHFTSPIRRYPDLIVHRILKDVLRDAAEQEDHGVPVGVGGMAHSESPSPWSKRTKGSGGTGERAATARISSSEPAPIEGESSSPAESAAGAPFTPPLVEWDSSKSTASIKRAPETSHKKRRRAETADHTPHQTPTRVPAPIPEEELRDIAAESSQSERRADEAERELMEWKKMKFMEQHIGEDFDGLIVSVTKFGMFVELNDMFIEGLVPLGSLTDDHYLYYENTRQLIGQRTRKTYSMGDPIQVIVDRIDRMQRRIQFAVLEERVVQPKRSKGEKKKKSKK